jgi:hypothetical protein
MAKEAALPVLNVALMHSTIRGVQEVQLHTLQGQKTKQ